MKIKLTLKDYLRQLQLMNKQYAQEEALYPWIYMLLQMTKHKDVSIQLIAKASNTKALPGRKLLGGKKNDNISLAFPDIAILGNKFDATAIKSEDSKSTNEQLPYIYGCVECKKSDSKLSDLDSGTYSIISNFVQIKFNRDAKNVILKELKTTINPVAFVVDILPTPENVCYLRSITKYEQLKDPAGTLSKLLDNFYDDKDFKDKKNIFIKPRLNTFILKKRDNSLLPFDPDISEIIGELLWYGQVLYTNGRIWKYFKITKLNYSDESSNLNFIDLREKLLHDKSFVFENLVFEIDVAEIANLPDTHPNSESASEAWNNLLKELTNINWHQEPTIKTN